jgi:hypothetical protein
VKRSVRGSDKKCDSAILVSLHWGPLAGETAFKAVPRERARAEASPRPAEGAIDVELRAPRAYVRSSSERGHSGGCASRLG